MNKIGKLEIKGMAFHSFHGCYDEEKQRGNDFLVDFEGKYDMSKACFTDKIEDAVDVESIYRIIEAEMKIDSNLLECVAGRIARRIEKEESNLENFSIKVTKLNPPINRGKAEGTSVTIFGGK